MKHATVSALEILRAPPANRREALDLVLQDVPDARRADHITGLLAAADAGQIDLDGLLLARRYAEIVGAAWAYLQPGRVASVWPAVAREAEPEATADALLEKVTLWLAHSGTQVAQALLAVDARQQTAQMARAGFTHMADLLYMVCLAGSFPTARPESGLQFEPAGATALARLATVVERTYEQTLDCPQLNGVRDVHDVLAGYRACGVFAAERWLIVHESGREVGCLLLTDHAGDDQWEIVYAGLVPEARGHSYGLAIARHAAWLARKARRARLVLAVDAANAPAVKMYERAGFVVWDRRRALLRIFPCGGS